MNTTPADKLTDGLCSHKTETDDGSYNERASSRVITRVIFTCPHVTVFPCTELTNFS